MYYFETYFTGFFFTGISGKSLTNVTNSLILDVVVALDYASD